MLNATDEVQDQFDPYMMDDIVEINMFKDDGTVYHFPSIKGSKF